MSPSIGRTPHDACVLALGWTATSAGTGAGIARLLWPCLRCLALVRLRWFGLSFAGCVRWLALARGCVGWLAAGSRLAGLAAPLAGCLAGCAGAGALPAGVSRALLLVRLRSPALCADAPGAVPLGVPRCGGTMPLPLGYDPLRPCLGTALY